MKSRSEYMPQAYAIVVGVILGILATALIYRVNAMSGRARPIGHHHASNMRHRHASMFS